MLDNLKKEMISYPQSQEDMASCTYLMHSLNTKRKRLSVDQISTYLDPFQSDQKKMKMIKVSKNYRKGFVNHETITWGGIKKKISWDHLLK